MLQSQSSPFHTLWNWKWKKADSLVPDQWTSHLPFMEGNGLSYSSFILWISRLKTDLLGRFIASLKAIYFFLVHSIMALIAALYTVFDLGPVLASDSASDWG